MILCSILKCKNFNPRNYYNCKLFNNSTISRSLFTKNKEEDIPGYMRYYIKRQCIFYGKVCILNKLYFFNRDNKK